ncbi:hypothetical protein GGR50DRAFT_686691 [Xylaria sp. CBS 124048]|nr:hypothetical protein GGR50DRAFT_686691 [Xylaria sp. CBS 124048]
MPFFRGIEISVNASVEAKQITEYPHPDGSSVRLLRASMLPLTCGRVFDPDASSSSAENVDPTRLKKVNPRISVYIPSLPGEQFWIRYVVSQSPPPSRCIFFKMTMNGRHVSSWGIRADKCSTGVVARALYQPLDNWGDACGPNEPSCPGIETRSFHFTPALGEKSAAEDGGVIEIQVFRCKGRKRIALELDTYRNQDSYGITSLSGGLVDNPEDATYYNYYLIDAKDAPYATFCFHYRSMKYLEQLNLIPQSELETSPASNKSVDIHKERNMEFSRSGVIPLVARRFTIETAAAESTIFDDDINAEEEADPERLEQSREQDFLLKSPPDLSQSPTWRGTALELSHWAPEDNVSVETQERPLPEVPNGLRRPASASSLRSNCPSLTPSLRQFADSEDFENEEISLSVAQPMLITSESMQALELIGADASVSDYETSPSSTEPSHSPRLPSPAGYIATTGSVLERHLNQYDSFVANSPSIGQLPSPRTDGHLDIDQTEPRASVFNLTEAEWLRRTPSPLQKGGQRAEGLESPGLGSHAEGGVATLEEGAQSMSLNDYVQDHTGAIGQAPVGNWI